MHHLKKKRELTVIDAVDNLTHMAEIDVNGEQNSETAVQNREKVKETFIVILHYLKHLYEKEKGHLRDPNIQKGIQAIMVLANEATQKLDKSTEIAKGRKETSIEETKEYQELQQFYLTKIVQKFSGIVDQKEIWAKEWGTSDETSTKGLTNLDAIRADKHYELFLIHKEDGKPFFNHSLLRHLKLIGDFDQIMNEKKGENSFVRLKLIQDRDIYLSAKEVLHAIAPYVDDYYKESMKRKNLDFIATLNKALMALMLAANVRNLMSATTGKNCLKYYADFQFYLREAVSSPDYFRYLSMPIDKIDRFFHTVLNLTHALCTAFFTCASSKKEMLAQIHLLIEKGGTEVNSESAQNSTTFWNSLLDDDADIRLTLQDYPNGPILKSIELFRAEEYLTGFDPFAQGNYPSQMYTISNEQIHISCLKLPSPTRQQNIAGAEVVEEFNAFLNAIGSEKQHQKLLLINLQDRTSWEEHARCLALENLDTGKDSLFVVSLPKNTEFYHQSGSYHSLSSARDFIKALKEQVLDEDQSSYFFPQSWKKEEFKGFVDQATALIHELCFSGKEVLLHKNRLDFIEIFDLFLILKTADLYQPDMISFTCKDGIDAGAVLSAELYAFIRIMNRPKNWTKEEKDFLLWMLYSSALTLRERAVNEQMLNRMISAMAVVNGELEVISKGALAKLSNLYKTSFFEGTRVQET